MELYCSLILSVCTNCTGGVGAVETGTRVSVEALVGYYPCIMTTLTRTTDRGGRQCQVGSSGAVASPKGNGGAQRFAQNGWK